MIVVENSLCGSRPVRSRDHPHSCKSTKKQRSRSSPVRVAAPAACSFRRRPRSPSVSPPRISPSRPPSPYRSCYHLLKQREGACYKSAYFSERPPVEPMRLAMIDGTALPAVPALVFYSKALNSPASGLLKIPKYIPKIPSIEPKDTDNHYWTRPCGSHTSCHIVLRLLSELAQQSPFESVELLPYPSESTALKLDGNADISVEGRQALQPLQSEEINDLTPALAAEILPQDSVLPCTEVYPVVVGTIATVPIPMTVRADSLTPITAAGDCRNVAVQAHTRLRHKRDNTSKIPREVQAKPEPLPIEGWIGDVRALRDSHVRLVRRQLRHIDRLNRTLDHARKYEESKVTLSNSSARKCSPRATQK